jgi:RND family efflux transporter MFP subunit
MLFGVVAKSAEAGMASGWTISLGAVVIFALAACSGPAAPPPPPELPVTVAKPVIKRIQEWDEYTGRFAAVDYVEVRSRVSGYLTRVAFRDGQIVDRGDLLYVIDPRPFQVALQDARAQLADAQARLEFARADLKRAEQLRVSQTVPERVFDQRRQEQRAAEAGVGRAQAAVARAEVDLSYTEIRASIRGRTSATSVTAGNLVNAGAGPALTTIASLNPIHFVFDADEAAYLRYVRLNAAGDRPSSRDAPNPVQLQVQGETGFPHTGRMDFVDNQIDPQTGTMRGRAVFDNPGVLFIPGMFGRMRLLGSGLYDAMLIPDEAVGSDQTNKVVFVVQPDNSIAPRPVTLGPIVDGLRVVRSGITPNDRIVINGLMRLRPDLKVKPVDGKIEAPAAAPAAGRP